MKILAIIQARMGSTRFPGKVLEAIGEKTLIETLISRLCRSKYVTKIILATTDNDNDNALTDHVSKAGYDVFRGSENDVLGRFYSAANKYKSDVIVRITGDCPLIDPTIVDKVIDDLIKQDADYSSNIQPATFPDGLDVEAFSYKALEEAHEHAKEPRMREHVTPFLREMPQFKRVNTTNPRDFSNERWTVDEQEDLEVVKAIFSHFSPKTDFGWLEVIELRGKKPEIFLANSHLIRNEGAMLGTGQKLWKRARRVIPGGNMLLSKRAEMFLPDQWPAYFSKAKGCRVWDLDGVEYIDMSIMGVGTNTLGYGHPEVDLAVQSAIQQGNMSTFNCPEEVYLAERLVELHPWADMVRFARTGGEANAIAIRIARAASGRDKVAFCGYHGWHDWYLAANLGSEKNLSSHLLPGLEPNGVPQSLHNSVYPFSYNNFPELEALVSSQEIGVIFMEVSRNMGPAEGYLQKIRELATRKNIVLIFDECTSGFRSNFGGLHKLYGVEPDMAMFGKALGNGYAITAAIGRREIMQAAQTSFISSTFWTERIGPSAALKTLETMERVQSWQKITETGKTISLRWANLASRYGIKINMSGLPSLTSYSFESENNLAYKTFVTQEMLAKGFLAGTSVYVCTEHTSEIVDSYFENLDPVFSKIAEFENGLDVHTFLKGPVCHSGFKRLN